jgi:hypothetical protein
MLAEFWYRIYLKYVYFEDCERIGNVILRLDVARIGGGWNWPKVMFAGGFFPATV